MTMPDPRLHPLRDGVELAPIAHRQVSLPVASVHGAPREDARQVTQALMGERAAILEIRDGWAWVRLERDGYVGFIRSENLSEQTAAATHRVTVPHTFIYPGADIKSQPATILTLNAQLSVESADEKFAKLASGGYIFARHLSPVAEHAADFVATATMFLHAPYLWGGKSSLGLDCSGLVQLALEASGRDCPRDSDMQESALGASVMANDLDGLKRGDLVFWDGHVGIMADSANLLHANGHFMQVTIEPLRGAVERIATAYGAITSIKRLQ
jgi:cell wall-associated NlpC family hydrolase